MDIDIIFGDNFTFEDELDSDTAVE
jgi:hypothetical protein